MSLARKCCGRFYFRFHITRRKTAAVRRKIFVLYLNILELRFAGVSKRKEQEKLELQCNVFFTSSSKAFLYETQMRRIRARKGSGDIYTGCFGMNIATRVV